MGSTSSSTGGFSRTFQPLMSKSNVKILIVGFHDGGKTTILSKLNLGQITQSTPEDGIDLETVKFSKITFNALSIDCSDKMRPVLRKYFKNSHGLVFVFDSSNKSLVDQARAQLRWVIDTDGLDASALLVFANKQDIQTISVDDITMQLGLQKYYELDWHVQPSCAVSGEGLNEGFQWLANSLSGPSTKKVALDSHDLHTARIPIIGLYGGGKKTILSHLSASQSSYIPVSGMRLKTFMHKNINFVVSDIVRDKSRPVLRSFFKHIKGLVFVVDSCDHKRIDEARDELRWALDTDDIGAFALLVLANKQDSPQAMTLAEVTENLGLQRIDHMKWHVQPTCGRTGEGVNEGFDWLVNNVSAPPKRSAEDSEPPKVGSQKQNRSPYETVVSEVEQGNNIAKTKLAWYLLTGRGGAEIDRERAVELLKDRAKSNNSEAMWMLGLCYEFGLGCEQDIKEAESLYRQSSDAENIIGDFLQHNGNDDRGSGVMKPHCLQSDLQRLYIVLDIAPWLVLDLSGYDIGIEGARAISERLKNEKCSLTKLMIESRAIGSKETTLISEALETNTSLTALHFASTTVGDEGARIISEALKQNTTLVSLNLYFNGIGDDGAKKISEALKENSTLTSLNLHDNRIGLEGVAKISEALKENTTLTSLNLNDNTIGSKGAKVLSEAIKMTVSLSELTLKSNQIGTEGAKMLSEGLSINTTLAKLNLGDNAIGDEGAEMISDALKTNTSLVLLYLNSNNIGDAGAQKISESLMINPALTELGLWDNRIGDEGAMRIGESLTKNTALITVSLHNNKIGNEGARRISESLTSNTSLTKLVLSRNNIGDEGAKAFNESLMKNSTLTELDISGNNISE